MDIHIREKRLPGIGHRYEMPLGPDRSLVVVVQDRGRRELAVVSGEPTSRRPPSRSPRTRRWRWRRC